MNMNKNELTPCSNCYIPYVRRFTEIWKGKNTEVHWTFVQIYEMLFIWLGRSRGAGWGSNYNFRRRRFHTTVGKYFLTIRITGNWIKLPADDWPPALAPRMTGVVPCSCSFTVSDVFREYQNNRLVQEETQRSSPVCKSSLTRWIWRKGTSISSAVCLVIS